MAHRTPGGALFLLQNPGHSAASIHPGLLPTGFQRSLIGDIVVGLFGGECPDGQVDIPGIGCITLPFGPNDGGDPITTICAAGFVRDFAGNCVPSNGTVDVTPEGDTPAERGPLADGPALPGRICRNVHVCPKFLDGSMGILYFSPVGGQLVCLPRSMSPKAAMAFGLIRKNKPRSKALVTAADGRLLSKIGSIQSKIGTLAAKADALGCPPRQKKK